jgi:hypothetical protein
MPGIDVSSQELIVHVPCGGLIVAVPFAGCDVLHAAFRRGQQDGVMQFVQLVASKKVGSHHGPRTPSKTALYPPRANCPAAAPEARMTTWFWSFASGSQGVRAPWEL